MPWFVTGHFCPTDAIEDPGGQEQSAEDFVTTMVLDTEPEADNWLLWYPTDGKKTRVEEHLSDDSGGSSYLCCCRTGDDYRHENGDDWRCPYLNQFKAVA